MRATPSRPGRRAGRARWHAIASRLVLATLLAAASSGAALAEAPRLDARALFNDSGLPELNPIAELLAAQRIDQAADAVIETRAQAAAVSDAGVPFDRIALPPAPTPAQQAWHSFMAARADPPAATAPAGQAAASAAAAPATPPAPPVSTAQVSPPANVPVDVPFDVPPAGIPSAPLPSVSAPTTLALHRRPALSGLLTQPPALPDLAQVLMAASAESPRLAEIGDRLAQAVDHVAHGPDSSDLIVVTAMAQTPRAARSSEAGAADSAAQTARQAGSGQLETVQTETDQAGTSQAGTQPAETQLAQSLPVESPPAGSATAVMPSGAEPTELAARGAPAVPAKAVAAEATAPVSTGEPLPAAALADAGAAAVSAATLTVTAAVTEAAASAATAVAPTMLAAPVVRVASSDAPAPASPAVTAAPAPTSATGPAAEVALASAGAPRAPAPPGMTIIRASDPPAPEPAPASSAATGPPAEAAAPVESLSDAIATALRDNPDIQIARARMDDARYGVMESRAAWLPKVDVSVGGGQEFNNPSEGDTGFALRREGTVSMRQMLWDFGVALNDIRRARALFEAAEWSAREQIEAISFEIASAYIAVLERDRLVQLTRDNIAAHERILRMVETQKELGLSTGADVSRVEARLNNVKAGLLDRESARDQAREAYRRLVTRLPGQVIDPPSTDGILPAEADAAVALIDKSSPPLMQVISERTSLERQRASQFGNFFPKFEMEVQGNWKDDVSGDTNRNRDARAMVTMRYNLFNGGADYAVRRRLDARIREATFAVDRVRRDVEQDVRNDFNALRAAREKVSTINGEVAAAERVVELYSEQFKTGKRTAFDLLDSQQALFTAKASQVSNQYQQVISSYRVLQKLGQLFTHITQNDVDLAAR